MTSVCVDWLNDPEVNRFSKNRHVHHTLKLCREDLKICTIAEELHDEFTLGWLCALFSAQTKRLIDLNIGVPEDLVLCGGIANN